MAERYLIPAVFELIFICFLILLSRNAYYGYKSVSWKHVPGKLLYFRIVRSRVFSVKVKYEYEIDGKLYTGKRISFFNPGYGSENEINTNKQLSKIKNDDFDVYYDEGGKLSTLVTGFDGLTTTIFLAVLLIAGMVSIAYAAFHGM